MATSNNNNGRAIDLSTVASVSNPDTGARLMAVSPAGQLTPVTIDRLIELVGDKFLPCGRNIVTGSAVGITSSEYTLCALPWGNDVPSLGDSLTVTLWGELGDDRERFLVINGGGDGTRGSCNPMEVAPGVYMATLKIRGDGVFNGVRIYHVPSSGNSYSRIDMVKIERGETGTYWTPAPEDLMENRGGVKFTLPTCYASRVRQSARKGGVQHERKDYRAAGFSEIAAEHRGSNRAVSALLQFFGRADRVESLDPAVPCKCPRHRRHHHHRVLSTCTGRRGYYTSGDLAKYIGSDHIFRYIYLRTDALPSIQLPKAATTSAPERGLARLDEVRVRGSLNGRKEVVAA